MKGGGADGGVAKPGMKKTLSVKANIMTPVKPMLVCEVGGSQYHAMRNPFYMGHNI